MNSQKQNAEHYFGLLGFDKLPPPIKFAIWVVLYIFITRLTQEIDGNIINSIHWHTRNQFNWIAWLAIGSPIIFGTALVRLAGINWKYAFLFLVAVPITIQIEKFLSGLLWALMMGG